MATSHVATSSPPPKDVLDRMGGPEAFELLRDLIALDTTNLEDPAHHREEKRHYVEAAQFLQKKAQAFGLKARIWDAREELPQGRSKFHGPRPSVIADLDRGKASTVLVLAHLDVVPVPDEQLSRWQSPPHELTYRAGLGRLFGRGSNDDLGSGVLSSLFALRALATTKDLPVNVRLLICPDEETGGAGGIEAIAEHDQALPPNDPKRLLRGELALIPDGAPYVAAGCSGVAFIDLGMDGSVPLQDHLALGDGVLGFEPTARSWVSRLPSPDHPDHGAPDAHITGRATLTKMDLGADPDGVRSARPSLRRAHAESDAANQISEAVTLSFSGEPSKLDDLLSFLEKHVVEPYRLVVLGDQHGASKSAGTLELRVIGRAGHAGYPHKAANPVPVTVGLLLASCREGVLEGETRTTGGYTLDLRSPPEMPSEDVIALFDNRFRLLRSELPRARYDAPLARRRSGYALEVNHPAVLAVRQAFEEVAGGSVGVFGEYGGTDASALRDLTTPSGKPLPAIVVGAMDRDAHIHDAEESADPRLLGMVQRLLVRCIEAVEPPPSAS
ncbi:MAG: M20/M25/M40 family metallo-hydrolase [Euryarchaeota archaeon]|nr:M20/M25/M40 family metallo-hydrolase [Euryarchaeota archaeon]MDE1835902.1 M20/M25/M40 family metallo-hydrolase [Euryarchaeota archaeon]MDE1880223.1 M20/M25/M40 family metallo-hydrolase [Euryarchaeota archaeon]MDE2044420.1 M20/M25/M40 family metallo-hydrolase [Thermoplasmata archaeon]